MGQNQQPVGQMTQKNDPFQIDSMDALRALEKHRLSRHLPIDKPTIRRIALHMTDHGYMSDCPIVLYEGKVLDGWLRLKAAVAAKTTPWFTNFKGTRTEAVELVFEKNSIRKSIPKSELVAGYLRNKPTLSDAEIADLTGCAYATVGKVRRRLKL